MFTLAATKRVSGFSLGLVSLAWMLLCVSTSAGAKDGAVTYLYADNKQLVRLVEEAASLIERRGTDAFHDFSLKGSKWLDDERYMFVYDDQGMVAFHPIEHELVGQDLSHFEDIQGRPVIASMMAIGQKPEPDASGWVFYLWEGTWHTRPEWKGSYVRKAISPDGRVFLVGSGLYSVKIEKAFIEEGVDKAAELIHELGKEAAFAELRRVSCPLHILDAYIRVTDDEGNVLVDPLFPGLAKKRNISQEVDFIGKNVFQDTKAALQRSDAAWTSFTVPKPGSGLPEKRLIYARKVKLGDETLFIGASFTPASPIWLK
jgi:signal transduction histidine kinase